MSLKDKIKAIPVEEEEIEGEEDDEPEKKPVNQDSGHHILGGALGGSGGIASKIKTMNERIKEEGDPDAERFQQKYQSLKTRLNRLKDERESMPMPRDSSDPRKTKYQRAQNMKKIKKVQKELDSMKIVKKKNLPPPDDFEHERYRNLAGQIGYKCYGLESMDRQQFEIEKKNIIEKADRFYGDAANIATDYLLMMSHVTDGYPSLYGYSFDLAKGRKNIIRQVKKCMIYEGMKGQDMMSYFGNPWLGFGLAMGIPMLARYQHNKALTRKGENPMEMAQKQLENAKKAANLDPKKKKS